MKKLIADKIRSYSIKRALKSRGLVKQYNKLCRIVPNINDQYTSTKQLLSRSDKYMHLKVRAVHAFQMTLLERAIGSYTNDKKVRLNASKSVLGGVSGTIYGADLGDSSGNHTLYIKRLISQADMVSLNIDPVAVDKIRKKGLRAIWTTDEESYLLTAEKDFVVMFQVLEHIRDPIQFLKKLRCKTLILTVPYVKHSRVGLHGGNTPEDLHYFELCPADWKKLFKHTGWTIKEEHIYKQYPWWLWPLKYFWRWHDFEGFYGVVLGK